MIREAPWSVGAIAIAAAVASMAFIKLIDSSTIVAKDATIQTLTTENGEYKDKLSGKTPDEAKAQFDAMNGQILELEEKISTIGARHLKDHEKILLIESLRLPMDIAHPLTSVSFEMGCSDCQAYARDIANVLRSVGGWEQTSLDNASLLVCRY